MPAEVTLFVGPTHVTVMSVTMGALLWSGGLSGGSPSLGGSMVVFHVVMGALLWFWRFLMIRRESPVVMGAPWCLDEIFWWLFDLWPHQVSLFARAGLEQ